MSNRIDAESERLERGCAQQVSVPGFSHDNGHHTVGPVKAHEDASCVSLDCLAVSQQERTPGQTWSTETVKQLSGNPTERRARVDQQRHFG